MSTARHVVRLFIGLALCAGCATAPSTEADRDALDHNIQETFQQLKLKDPSLTDFLNKAYGIAFFPSVGKGGFGVGGAYGRGEVYEGRKQIGYADISQATLGLQIGGQSFTEILAFQDRAALDRFKSGQLKFAANASAVALKSGAAATAKYEDGVATFVDVRGGLMAEASIGGQSFSFSPLPANETAEVNPTTAPAPQ